MTNINQSAIALSVTAFGAFESAQVNFNESRERFGRAMCAILPLEISFEDYTATAKAWKAAYKGASDNANDQAWSRAVGFMNGYLASIKAETFVIPKAETKEATRKAEQRKAHQEKVEAAAKTAKPADLQKRATAGDKVALDAIAFLGKQAREANAARNAGIYKSVIVELRNHKDDLNLLQQVAKLLHIK